MGTEEWTDMMKLTVAFIHFVNAPKMKPLRGGRPNSCRKNM